MDVYLFDGLICTDLRITYKGKSKILKNVVIDTGAVQSIINAVHVEDIGITPSASDKPAKSWGIGGEMKFFYRLVEELVIGDFLISNFELDFGVLDPKGEISGLIGLDLLNSLRAVIDIEIPVVYNKK